MKKINFKIDGLIGIAHFPESQNGPGIILLSGSDGGIPGSNAIPESFIFKLVEHGIAVLSLGYFGMENVPNYLESIDLGNFQKAIHWFKSQPFITKDSIGIIGQSRGAELSLLLGVTFPEDIKAIVSYVPCNMVCGGFPYPNKAAWIYQGNPISPFLGGLSTAEVNLTELDDLENSALKGLIPKHENTAQDPFIISELFAARYRLKSNVLAEIPVEKLECPLLLISGGQDAIWPSSFYCQKIIERLENHNVHIPYEHINYEDAGHGIIANYEGAIYHPVGKFWCKLGGTSEGNKLATQESLYSVFEFLKKYLQN